MTACRAVFLDLVPLNQNDLDLSPLQHSVSELVCHDYSLPDQVIERLQGAQIAIANKVRLDARTLAASPALRLILVSATGYNNVDLEAARQRQITVCNCQGYGTASVAQHTLALLLALATRLPDYQAAVHRGDWSRSRDFCLLDYPITELSGKTLGILGHGTLGSEVARLASAFGLQILSGQLPGRPSRPDQLPLHDLLPRVDALSLHCPLTENTRHLIGAPELALMKPGALLINTARGGIVDEQALAQALRNGQLGGAATDVLESEPPGADNPLLAPDLPRLIITPHSAWGSREARQRIVQQLGENARAFLQGQPLRVVC